MESRQLGPSRWQQGYCADAAVVLVDRQSFAISGSGSNKHRCKLEIAKRLGRCVPLLFCRVPGAVREEKGRLKNLSFHEPFFFERDDPMWVHQALAGTLDTVLARIRQFEHEARSLSPGQPPQKPTRPRQLMVVPCTSKGSTSAVLVKPGHVRRTGRCRTIINRTAVCPKGLEPSHTTKKFRLMMATLPPDLAGLPTHQPNPATQPKLVCPGTGRPDRQG